MRRSDRILRQVRRALIAAFVLAGCASGLFAALALHALPLIPRDLSLPQAEQLWLLMASAAAAALVLLCAVTYALYLLGNKGLVARLGSALLTSASMVTSTVAILLHFLLTHDLTALAVPMPVVWYSLGMAVLSTVIPSYLLIEALARIGPGPASVATGAGPVITADRTPNRRQLPARRVMVASGLPP